MSKKIENRLYCNKCKRFLPDRYVIGICPKCGATSKGDACEKCGCILEPEDLKDPLRKEDSPVDCFWHKAGESRNCFRSDTDRCRTLVRVTDSIKKLGLT